MPESFELPVIFQGKEILFPAELFATGFSYKIKVMVEGIGVFFEPDEEKNYRATDSKSCDGRCSICPIPQT